MSGLDELEEAQENMFFHNEELRFKARMRRNRLIGLWAAEKLGKSQEAAENYSKELILASVKEPGDDGVVYKIMEDFKAANVVFDESVLREKMAQLLKEALADIREQ